MLFVHGVSGTQILSQLGACAQLLVTCEVFCWSAPASRLQAHSLCLVHTVLRSSTDCNSAADMEYGSTPHISPPTQQEDFGTVALEPGSCPRSLTCTCAQLRISCAATQEQHTVDRTSNKTLLAFLHAGPNHYAEQRLGGTPVHVQKSQVTPFQTCSHSGLQPLQQTTPACNEQAHTPPSTSSINTMPCTRTTPHKPVRPSSLLLPRSCRQAWAVANCLTRWQATLDMHGTQPLTRSCQLPQQPQLTSLLSQDNYCKALTHDGNASLAPKRNYKPCPKTILQAWTNNLVQHLLKKPAGTRHTPTTRLALSDAQPAIPVRSPCTLPHTTRLSPMHSAASRCVVTACCLPCCAVLCYAPGP